MTTSSKSSICLFAVVLLGAVGIRSAVADPIASGPRAVTVDGVARTYTVHVPPHVTRPAPVVLVFHGGGGRPEGIARKTEMDALADRDGFVVVYPAGLGRVAGRGTWNVGGPLTAGTADDVAFVRAILRNLERELPIDHARIYAAGLSMGGVFAYRLACEMSDTFAGIAAVSATMVEPSCHPSRPVAVLHVHGARDARIPLAGGHGAETALERNWPAPETGVSAWRRLDGCAGAPTRDTQGVVACTTYGACRASVEYCVVSDQGHGWPDAASSFATSQRVWAFFVAHPKLAP